MSTTLKKILSAIDHSEVKGDWSIEIPGVTHDSRNIAAGWAFVAIPGANADGNKFIADALRSGAAVIISEKPPIGDHAGVAWVTVLDARRALAMAAAIVNGEPTARMTLVGITGTNGKTTLTYLLEQIIAAAGGVPGVIGTVTYRWRGREFPAARTTPEASDLQEIFAEMQREGVTHAIIEASSHGLHMDRLVGCHFDVGVFTNLSQDHLDYHRDLEDYYQAKRLLFTRLLPASCKRDVAAVVNMDEPYGRRLAGEIGNLSVTRFGTSAECDIHPQEAHLNSDGIRAAIYGPKGTVHIRSALAGAFNLSNILAAVAVSTRLNIPAHAVTEGIQAVSVVPGRLERVPSDRGSIFVDYAHTPDALTNVIEALQSIRKGRIITVMGCGGDRDKTKRPLMGKQAAAGSDFVVITSDNPRTEDPLAIINQIVEGVLAAGFKLYSDPLDGSSPASGSYCVIPDRREAVAWAVKKVRNHDILLVAGKGHETYQEINGVRYPFDDRQIVREELRKRSAVNGDAARRTEPESMTGDRHGSGRYPQ